MRNFYMVRHGETTANRDRVATGQMNVGLTEKGRQQAIKCRDIIQNNGLKPDVILCSVLRRTKQTADIINRDLNCPLYQHQELNEQRFGDWEGKPWDIVLSEIGRYGENPPNGETLRDFIERIKNAFETLLYQYEGTILFVTHSGVFKSIFNIYGYNSEKVKNCVLYELIFSVNENYLEGLKPFN